MVVHRIDVYKRQVVDDAIIVVEAVQARFDVGYRSSYMASIDAMKGISNAVITSSLVFMACLLYTSRCV